MTNHQTHTLPQTSQRASSQHTASTIDAIVAEMKTLQTAHDEIQWAHHLRAEAPADRAIADLALHQVQVRLRTLAERKEELRKTAAEMGRTHLEEEVDSWVGHRVGGLGGLVEPGVGRGEKLEVVEEGSARWKGMGEPVKGRNWDEEGVVVVGVGRVEWREADDDDARGLTGRLSPEAAAHPHPYEQLLLGEPFLFKMPDGISTAPAVHPQKREDAPLPVASQVGGLEGAELASS